MIDVTTLTLKELYSINYAIQMEIFKRIWWVILLIIAIYVTFLIIKDKFFNK